MAMRGAGTESAVEGLPMTLIIVMVILAITVPMMFSSLRYYDRARTEAELLSEIDDFSLMVRMLYEAGPGNSAVIDFEAANGIMSSIDSVKFGDASGGSYASAVRYTVHGKPELIAMVSQPTVPMMSAEDCALEIASGTYHITAECQTSAYDLNGDGIFQDTCVRLSLPE